MEDASREDLRRLALWLSRRRAVDQAVGMLTAYGPAASDRVHAHLDALKLLLALEQEAFAGVEATAPAVPQRPLPGTLEHAAGRGASIHSLSEQRDRSSG